MGSRVVRGTAIACAVAGVAGLGIGFAAGEPVDAEDIRPARRISGGVCVGIGDVSALLPVASKAGPVRLVQTGTGAVKCSAGVQLKESRTFSSGSIAITLTPYAGKQAAAGQEPLSPETVAKGAFDRRPVTVMSGRPHPTKASLQRQGSGDGWSAQVIVLYGDVVVQVDYVASPADGPVVEQVALLLADRAIWEIR